ncbi:MAG: helix-turn-helix transcriptional regulator [Chitinophagaceae bacterium]|nr:helix-turn-helix transcriptional regulator [Chitinophagaceae bacterium]
MINDVRLQELKKAILYLKRKERVRNNTEVAAMMDISSSYLSQMLNGNKPFTDTFFEKFESIFNINLDDPFTYTDLDWVTEPTNQKTAGPDNNKELFNSMKKLLRLKDKETENQRRIINAQQQLIGNLQKELDVLKTFIKN